MDEQQQDHLSDLGLQMDSEVRQQLSVAGKWSKFISILIFICCGILLIAGLAGGGDIVRELQNISPVYKNFSALEGGILIGIVVFVVLILVIMYYFLFNFSAKIKTALLSENSRELNSGLKSLKIYFIITTIIAIISLLGSLSNFFN